ncbi:diguanylate cyclase [Thermomonas sp.]|uniref:diguanylate cyclase n=1 Tax=Thermomonas sp. TaxID=1971895 RepID=UPI00248A4880|nr:diguanylate cyclase [Thermomonas sp.]MDI1254051.1 diguanylate cyclase [Thermomonas sp.]
MNNDTRQRSRTGLIMAAVIFIAIGVGVVLGAHRLIMDASSVTHSNEVIVRIDELEARLRDAEAAQRGYLLTANPIFLADYRNASEKLPGIYADLRGRIHDNPAQLARAQSLWAHVQQRARQLAQTLSRYREGGLPAAQAAIDHGVIESSTAIRQQAEAMREAEVILLVQRGESTHDSANLLRELALLGIPIGILVILSVYRLLVLEIRRRGQAEGETAQANEQLQVTLERVELRSTELRALSNYGSMLQSCAQPEEAWQLTESLFATILPDAAGSIYRIRNSQDHAELAAQWGETAQVSPEMIAVDACWALRRGQPHATDAMHGARCTHLGAEGAVDSTDLCVPLVAQGAQLGLLSLSSSEQSLSAHRDIIEAAVEKLSMALANLSLQDRLRQQSIRDPLTGLFNRRYLEESATRELARCARRGLPLSLLMLDIDHFKSFNDLHGHAGGDTVLAQFGKLLQTITRGEDIVCRYGGEEFTLILPEADVEAASARAEAIRLAVEAMQVPYLGKLLPKVTVSIGVAGYPAHGQTQETLMQAADKALYQAKRAGRNRIEIAIGM